MENTPETALETTDEDLTNAPRDKGPAAPTKYELKLKKKALKKELDDAMKADPTSRSLFRLSLFFAAIALTCFGYLGMNLYKKKQAHTVIAVEVAPAKPAEAITQTFDVINVVLKNEQELRVELVAECSQKETCNFLKENPEQARDLLIPVLSNIDPQEFMKIENKDFVRKRLTDRLNSLEMPGKVIQIHFTNLGIEGNAVK